MKSFKELFTIADKDNTNKVIIYSQVRHEVIVESKKFYDRVINKIYGADCLFVDLTAIISDVYPPNYKISMVTIQAVLREYVI